MDLRSFRQKGFKGFLLILLFSMTALGLSGSVLQAALRRLDFQGQGPSQIDVSWSGPAVLHISAASAQTPLKVLLQNGLDQEELVQQSGPVDEYRSYEFPTAGKARLSVQGNRAWDITITPVSSAYYPTLHIPGKVDSQNGAVILLEGKSGVATFDLDRAENLTAWAYGPGGIQQQLFITPSGDYKGKSVLPKGAQWLVVSAQGPWSVDVQAPCCEAAPW